MPLALLIGPDTASSGDATPVAFLDKSNVRTFGIPADTYIHFNPFIAEKSMVDFHDPVIQAAVEWIHAESDQ